MNIWEQYEFNGALYEFVPTFVVRGLVGAGSLVGERTGWTYDELNSFISNTQSRHEDAIDRVSLEYMIQGSLGAYLNIDEGTCDFDTASFHQWMEMTKYLTSVECPDNAHLWTANMMLGVDELLSLKAHFQETPIFMGFPSDNGVGPYAAAIDSFAISSSTEYPEVCWEFLCSLMDEDLLGEFIGIPMKKSILDKQLSSAMLDPLDPNFPFQTDEYTLLSLTQEEVNYFLNMVNSIDHVMLRYDGITNIITEEMTLWLNDQQSTEATIEYLQNRIEIYLSEQSK